MSNLSKSQKRALWAVGLIAAVVVVIWVSVQHAPSPTGKSNAPPPVTTPVTFVSPPSTLPTARPSASSSTTTANSHSQSTTTSLPGSAVQPSSSTTTSAPTPVSQSVPPVVTAAATAETNLSMVVLQPTALMRSTIEKLAVPSEYQTLEATYTQFAPLLAQTMGYPTVAKARNSGSYYETVEAYKVVDIQPQASATVLLYTITHWVSGASGETYEAPAITVVHMSWQNGRWLYVESTDPTASQAPPPELNLTYTQTVARLQSYLKGYSSYVNGNS